MGQQATTTTWKPDGLTPEQRLAQSLARFKGKLGARVTGAVLGGCKPPALDATGEPRRLGGDNDGWSYIQEIAAWAVHDYKGRIHDGEEVIRAYLADRGYDEDGRTNLGKHSAFFEIMLRKSGAITSDGPLSNADYNLIATAATAWRRTAARRVGEAVDALWEATKGN